MPEILTESSAFCFSLSHIGLSEELAVEEVELVLSVEGLHRADVFHRFGGDLARLGQ